MGGGDEGVSVNVMNIIGKNNIISKSTSRQISLVFSLGICLLTFFSGVASLTASYSMGVSPSEEQACELDRKRK